MGGGEPEGASDGVAKQSSGYLRNALCGSCCHSLSDIAITRDFEEIVQCINKILLKYSGRDSTRSRLQDLVAKAANPSSYTHSSIELHMNNRARGRLPRGHSALNLNLDIL
jgi:hypothetical protein